MAPATKSTAPVHTHITTPFLNTLPTSTQELNHDDPNYYSSNPSSLVSSSTIRDFTTGTGSTIYKTLLPALESINHELLLVTCFWAQSPTLSTLNTLLRSLSNKAIQRGTSKIRVRLCFSSSSFFQKLFHSQSVTGQVYDSKVWSKKLGLPDVSELGGLDLEVKSVFVLPFSVMHPKFMVLDREKVVLPSCNVSWEEWFEGAITFDGEIVGQFLRFYAEFWERRGGLATIPFSSESSSAKKNTRASRGDDVTGDEGLKDNGHANVRTIFSANKSGAGSTVDVPTVFLPSPHRRNPNFQPFVAMEKVRAPTTPLNAFLLTLFDKAERSIRIQTPNLTSPPVLSRLLAALRRGVDLEIVTSEKLMILEQLVTAGTTTKRCIDKLVKRYKNLQSSNVPPTQRRSVEYDEEAALSSTSQPRIGKLKISYFQPLHGYKPRGQENGEPQQSHIKMTIVDDEVLVLGSGNLDRASWFTSQELGVAFFSQEVVEKVRRTVDLAIERRTKVVFESDA